MINESKPNVGVPQTYLNVGGGFHLLVGSTFKLIAGALGTGGMTNSSKVSSSELWETMTNTWVAENRTWERLGSLFSNTTKTFVSDEYLYSTEYSLANYTNNVNTKHAQSFLSKRGKLISTDFYLNKIGSPTGFIYSSIYAHSGTYGANGSVPTGTPLATSDPISTSSLSIGDRGYVRFNFSGDQQIILEDNTPYFVSIDYDEGTATDDARIWISFPTSDHAGRAAFFRTSWTTAVSTVDIFFRVNLQSTITNSSKP